MRIEFQGEPPLKGAFIIPKLIEIFVSTGILIFLRIVEHDLYPSVVFSFFYAFYSLDIVFRIITFIMCYKIYGDFLRYRHRMVVSKNKSPSLLLRSDYSWNIQLINVLLESKSKIAVNNQDWPKIWFIINFISEMKW